MKENSEGVRIVICGDVEPKRRIRELKLAIRRFHETVFIMSDPEKINDIREQVRRCTKSMRQLQCYEVFDTPCFQAPEELEPYEHVFNPAILSHEKSQISRECMAQSGCPPINRGRHWDRKFRG